MVTNQNQNVTDDQCRDAYRITKDRCAHFQKAANNSHNNNNNKRGGGGRGRGSNNEQIPRDCSLSNDVSCLNAFTMPSLPAKSNWPPTRLVRCFVGAEPPKALTKEQLLKQQPSGIPNLGNTCYANSIFQCLVRIGLDWEENKNNKNCVETTTTQKTNKKNNKNNDNNNNTVVDPISSILTQPRFLDHFLADWQPSASTTITDEDLS